jgi:hypothetical protein
MKRTLSLLLLVLLAPAAMVRAQSMGTLTENGVSMDVKAAVALFDDSGPSLTLYLLPFQPTADETAKLQAEDSLWLLSKESPDPKKWKNCPHGKFKLGWSFEKESVGDAKKATVYVYGYSVGEQGSNININKFGTDTDVSVTSPIKIGQDVTVTSKGSDTLSKTVMAWDLKVKAKVLPLKKKP